MPKKQSDKYSEFEAVTRWNVCQQLAKLLYRSDLCNEELMEGVEMLLNKETNQKK